MPYIKRLNWFTFKVDITSLQININIFMHEYLNGNNKIIIDEHIDLNGFCKENYKGKWSIISKVFQIYTVDWLLISQCDDNV